MSEFEDRPVVPIGPIVERIAKRSQARWERKDGTAQTIQRLDEIVGLALPAFLCAMNVGQPHYPAGTPPYPETGALNALRDVRNSGLAPDLDDPALRAIARSRLEAHWKGVIEQRAREDKRGTRVDVRERWPGG